MRSLAARATLFSKCLSSRELEIVAKEMLISLLEVFQMVFSRWARWAGYRVVILVLFALSLPLVRWLPGGGAVIWAGETKSKSIFDGKSLKGWKAPDMSVWSVEDKAITGTVTREHRPLENVFIVWQGGSVDDFELKFNFRMFGEKANSGMQFRSQVRERGLVHGYQADITKQGKSLGGIWDEYGPRNSLAARGEKSVIEENGKKTVTQFADAAELMTGIDLEQWNEYRIIAQGDHVTLMINGRVMSELIDREKGKALTTGVLAMPVIPEPMKVQYKDIQLIRLTKGTAK